MREMNQQPVQKLISLAKQYGITFFLKDGGVIIETTYEPQGKARELLIELQTVEKEVFEIVNQGAILVSEIMKLLGQWRTLTLRVQFEQQGAEPLSPSITWM